MQEDIHMNKNFENHYNLSAANQEHSCLSRSLDNMAHYYAVAVDGASIDRMRRIDREFRRYEEKQYGIRAK